MTDHPNCVTFGCGAGDYKGAEMERVRGALLSRLMSMFISMTEALNVCVRMWTVVHAPNLILKQFHELYKCVMMT